DLFVNDAGGFLGVFAATEAGGGDAVFVFTVEDEADAFVHAPFADHGASDGGDLADVATGAGVDVAGEHFFGDAAGEPHLDERQRPLAAVVGAVFLGERHGDAQGAAAGNDGDLVEGVGVLAFEPLHDGVAGFVVGGGELVLLIEDAALLGTAPAD